MINTRAFSGFRVLIVGCGNIAGDFDLNRGADAWPVTHAGAFKRHGGFNLLACVDPDEKRRSEFANHWGVSRHAASIEALQAQSAEFDVISLCSPTALHHEHLEAALNLKPRLIFCEKPLTHSIELSQTWVQACEKQDVQLVVNYTRQWDTAVESLIEQLRAGQWGHIRSAAGFYNKGILNNGGHMINLLLRILGPMNVIAATSEQYDFWPDDPTIAALLHTQGEKIPVTLTPANAQDYAYFELELICEKGTVRMCNGGLDWEIRKAVPSEHFKGYSTLATPEQQAGHYLQAMTLAVTEIHEFLKHGTTTRSTGSHAIAVHLLCNQLLEAAKKAATQVATASHPSIH